MSLVAACGPAPRPDPGEPDAPADVCATTTCGSGETCCSGACTTDSTCSFALTGLSTSTGYVGGGTYVHLHGTGFAEGMRAFIGDGRAPIRVVSPTEAVIVTPPARAASYDVRVELAGLTSTLPTAFDVASYGFTDAWLTLTMTTPRGNFPAMTTLQDGRVLIAGGMSASTVETILNTAETYDPLTHTTTPVGAMTVPRFATTAITLLDGRALVLGVCNGAGTVGCPNAAQRDIAELFDPVTDTFSVVPGRLHDATRYYVNPVLLPDGRVLVQSIHSNTLEIFDPDTNTFSLLPAASSFSEYGRPARLRDGRVVLVSPEGVEMFDPDTDTVSRVSSSGTSSNAVAIYTAPDGRVIVPGGVMDDGTNFVPQGTISVFDPATSIVGALPQSLTSPRMHFGSALLRDGSVMVAAGVDDAYPKTYWCSGFTFPTTSAVDHIDVSTGMVTSFPALPANIMDLVAVTMGDGSILVGGGTPCGSAMAYAQLYYLESAPIL